MCLMRRKEVDLLFRVSHALHKQIKTDISPLTIKKIINHPGRSWVDATAKYIIVSWNRSRPLAFTESHFMYYSWLNPPVGKVKGFSYIMNGYLNGQDMGPSSLWNSVAGPARKRFFGHIIDPLLTKPLHSRWLDIGLILFCFFAFSLTSLILIHKKKKRKKELCQYPGVLTYMWCLVGES